MKLDQGAIEGYLRARHGEKITLKEVSQLGGGAQGEQALKQFGYGEPLLVVYLTAGEENRLVFRRVRRNAFGRERPDDRAANVWLDYATFNQLPRHVRAVDKLAHLESGELTSLGSADELLLVTAYSPGVLYAADLKRLLNTGQAELGDLQRAEALAAYLAEIHQTRHEDPSLWRRRLRDLVGHGEGIMGLTDSYSRGLAFVNEMTLRAIEESANRWRWRLKPLSHRLSQVHGDFHPFNLLFEEDGSKFHLLDRSRGEWGEPADDVSCMTINYLFFSLQRTGRMDEPFRALHDRFWERYFALHPDEELPTAIQPWFAWRALVLASPVWYPTIAEDVRRKILSFAWRVMSSDYYDYRDVNQYLADL